jgi:hypothetical protein
MAFMGHLVLNTVQKSKGKAKNPLNGARQRARAYIACLPTLVPLAGFCFWDVTRAGFSTNRRGGYPPSQQPRKNYPGTSLKPQYPIWECLEI